MRQRGLSEAQARRLQIEGFVKDIALSSKTLSEELADELSYKLETL
jgi:Fe-S cluster assembly scaffold protein SufB